MEITRRADLIYIIIILFAIIYLFNFIYYFKLFIVGIRSCFFFFLHLLILHFIVLYLYITAIDIIRLRYGSRAVIRGSYVFFNENVLFLI